MKIFSSLVMTLIALSLFTGCQNKKIDVPVQTSALQSVYFDYDMDIIRSDAVPVMQGNAGYINQHGDLQVTIEGHCDNRGSNEYNLALGHRRAQSAANYLMNLGVDGGRLRIVSFGEERPVCQYDNEDCWQRNRRADFRKQ